MNREEITEAEENISYLLSVVDKNRISADYRAAIEKGDRKMAVHSLAEYFRTRPDCKEKGLGASY